ncbi:MAG TPA: O-methyltransferase [Polyangia bacterium]|nr:O-methyltransferase [Polyangia bacterium]
MSPSYRKINYSLRPAKHVERKMIFESLRRLSQLSKLEEYQYIGFGSVYFADFRLAHKGLGIDALTSVERDGNHRARFEFNRPYRCVNIEYGESTRILPTLSWEKPAILWLDYDGKLDLDVLTDIRTFVVEARPGSVVIVSVNVQGLKDPAKSSLDDLIRRVGSEKVPVGTTEKDLRSWGAAAIERRIIQNEIEENLAGRNGPLPPNQKVSYRQLYNFHYADDARMLTTGGLLFSESQRADVDRCSFEDFGYIRSADDATEIVVPRLTHKEIKHLDHQLPKATGAKSKTIQAPGIPSEDVDAYAAVYRYFPSFAEAEF